MNIANHALDMRRQASLNSLGNRRRFADSQDSHGWETLIQYAHQLGLQPHQVAAVPEIVWKASCPNCGVGELMLRPFKRELGVHGTYACASCGIWGDEGLFLRSFVETYSNRFTSRWTSLRPLTRLSPAIVLPGWRDWAEQFVRQSHRNLWGDREALEKVLLRGLEAERIVVQKIGWNPEDQWIDASTWGIQGQKRLRLSKGLVIPSRGANGTLEGIFLEPG